jgi:hypothetical protein
MPAVITVVNLAGIASAIWAKTIILQQFPTTIGAMERGRFGSIVNGFRSRFRFGRGFFRRGNHL